MPSFKPKTTKKIKVNKKSIVTLDGKHNEFINEFNKDEQDKIPKLKNERREILNELKENEETQNLSIEQVLDLKDRIEEINEEIKNIKMKKNSNIYLI